MEKPELNPVDIAGLCDAAQAAWDRAPPNARTAPFTWCGKQYVASSTTFRLLVRGADGEPIACRYH